MVSGMLIAPFLFSQSNISHRNIFLTHTFANDARIIEKAVELHNDMINEAKASAVSANWTMVAMFQPLPAIYSRYTNYRGGNVLGLDRFTGNFQCKQFSIRSPFFARRRPEY